MNIVSPLDICRRGLINSVMIMMNETPSAGFADLNWGQTRAASSVGHKCDHLSQKLILSVHRSTPFGLEQTSSIMNNSDLYQSYCFKYRNKFPKILIRENCERIQLEKADRAELSECHKLVEALKAELAEVKAELSTLKNARSSPFSSPRASAESQEDMEIMQKKIEELTKHSKEAST